MQTAPKLCQPRHEPRRPEQTALYQAMAGHLETFLAELGDRHLPSHVEGELRRFLDCGIFARGFSRWVCEKCGAETVVASSCKGRGFCPSCIGRRMSESAALLVDHVLPPVPVRQWVLTLPIELRYRLAYDGQLCSDVLAVFLRAVSGWYRRRARALGYADGRTGAVTVIQRANSDLRLAPHYHSIVLDGVYVGDGRNEPPRFIEAPTPTDAEIKQLVETIAGRAIRLLLRRGVLCDDVAAPDRLAEEEPVLAGLLQASVMDTAVTGERAGRHIRRVLSDPASGQRTGDLCFASRGFSLHAARRVREDQENKLEELCRYVLRPPLANGRLRWLDPDTLLLTLKRKWSDGTTHILLSPSELIARLAALVPPKGFNLTRYHGCLAPRSRLRALVIPAPPAPEDLAVVAARQQEPTATAPMRPRRIPWAELLRLVFRSEVDRCACGGRLKLVAFVTDPAEARRYLAHVGLPAEAPQNAPARAPPQAELAFELC